MENLISKELEEEIINNIPLVLLTIVFQYSSSLRFIPCSHQLNRCPFLVVHKSQIYFLKLYEKNPEYCHIVSLSMDHALHGSHTYVSKFRIFENDICGIIYHQNCIYIATRQAIYRCPENLQPLTVLYNKSNFECKHTCIDTKRNQLISIGMYHFNGGLSFYVYDLMTYKVDLHDISSEIALNLFYDERNDEIVLLTPSNIPQYGFEIRFFEPDSFKKKKKLNISIQINPRSTIFSPNSLFYYYEPSYSKISVFTRDGTQTEKICLPQCDQFNSHIKFNSSDCIAYHNDPLFPEIILFDYHKNAFVAIGICQ